MNTTGILDTPLKCTIPDQLGIDAAVTGVTNVLEHDTILKRTCRDAGGGRHGQLDSSYERGIGANSEEAREEHLDGSCERRLCTTEGKNRHLPSFYS